MANLKELMEEMEKLSKQANVLLKLSNYKECDDLSSMEYNKNSANELLLVDEYREILDKLEEIQWTLEYLKKPIIFEGILHLNNSDRYETDNQYYYTSGDSIEFLYYIETLNGEVASWRIGQVEHDGEDYYIVGYRDVKLDGLQVRIRK